MSEHTDDVRERSVPPVDVPLSVTPWVEGRHWSRNLVGEAGGSVYRLSRPDVQADAMRGVAPGDLYLKHGMGPVSTDVFAEAARLQWLAAYVPVPAVRLLFATGQGGGLPQHAEQRPRRDDRETWLLMDALPGRTAYEILDASADAPAVQAAVVDALVAFVQRVHAIPAVSCPFISDHHRRLLHARERLEAGVVDEDDFGAQHDGWTAHDVWNAMVALFPLDVDVVVTHGDFSLDNVVLTERHAGNGFEVVGCLDVGRLGVADRYQDLAILHDCLSEFGDALQARVFTEYGIIVVDDAKLRFHLALDEFF